MFNPPQTLHCLFLSTYDWASYLDLMYQDNKCLLLYIIVNQFMYKTETYLRDFSHNTVFLTELT